MAFRNKYLCLGLFMVLLVYMYISFPTWQRIFFSDGIGVINPEHGSHFHRDSDAWVKCVEGSFFDFPPIEFFTQIGPFKERPILVYNWDIMTDFLFIHQPSILQCDIPCYFASKMTMSPECMAEVDGFIFHPPTATNRDVKEMIFPNKQPYQQYVLFGTETSTHWPLYDNREYVQHMDINMTFRLDSQVPFTYFIDLEFYMNFWPQVEIKTSSAPVMMMISNCDPQLWRTGYLKRLMQLVKIDSYGSCLHNKEIPEKLSHETWWKAKWTLMAEYKFVIAFENSVHVDYVTEKLFHSFIVGTVPIYYGAPNVDTFLPSKHSALLVQDFDSPESLAMKIRELDENEAAYRSYLSWVNDGPSKTFRDLQHTSPRTGPCRLCKEIQQNQRKLINGRN